MKLGVFILSVYSEFHPGLLIPAYNAASFQSTSFQIRSVFHSIVRHFVSHHKYTHKESKWNDFSPPHNIFLKFRIPFGFSTLRFRLEAHFIPNSPPPPAHSDFPTWRKVYFMSDANLYTFICNFVHNSWRERQYNFFKWKFRFLIFDFWFSTYLTCLACKSPGIYPVDCFQQGARTSRFGAKPPAPQYYKVATYGN